MKSIISLTLLLFITAARLSAQTDTTSYSYVTPLFDFEPSKAIFELSNEQKTNGSRYLRFSVLTGYREGVKPIQGYANFAVFPDEQSGTRRFCMFNLAIMDMLTHGFYKRSNVVLEVKDPSKYAYDPKYGSEEEWLRKNGHCFEMVLPAAAVNGAKTLTNELCQVLGVTFSREKRKAKVLVLVRTSNVDKLKAKAIGSGGYDMKGNFTNWSISEGRFGHALNNAGMPPVVDETGYIGPVDMQLGIEDWTDLVAVRKALQRYDLDLKEEYRELDMFVITENGWKKP